ncbi:hypothetical protein PspLS_06044 [Pyricularia sp. CBS 133598]|nr:hypothetical protein PspLS_06044 [Pyricularia sp. CBS 133598]
MSAYSPYGSYSSLYTTSAPMEIGSGSFLSRPRYATMDSYNTTSFPSWPRRSSLSESEQADRPATSFLSDEDLIFDTDPFSEDDARSVSSSGSGSCSPNQPTRYDARAEEEEARRQLQRQQKAALQRQALQMIQEEKERRRAMRQRQLQRRKSSGPSNKSKTAGAAMDPIAE